MGGGLMQLVAYGAQDIYLTGNPQITFFKVVYRRHTNFSMESIEQTFNGTPDFGRKVVCTISRNGDLIHRIYLQVELPGVKADANAYFRWVNWVGHTLIKNVEVEIGGQRIDKHYGDWLHIWNELTQTAGKQAGYASMVGNVDRLFRPVSDGTNAGGTVGTSPQEVAGQVGVMPKTTLFIPLQFWFCRNPGLALPLIALQYHEVKINLDLRPIDECLWAVTALGCEAGAAKTAATATIAYNQSLVAASLYVDYLFLDSDERRRFAQNPHEYLITQLQFTGDESVGSSSNKIKLNFNHPCKELVWVVQPDANVDYCSSFKGGNALHSTMGAQPFNYTDAIDALPNSIMAFSSDASAGNVISATGLFADGNVVAATADVAGSVVTAAVSDAASFVLAETALDMHCWGENPVVTAKLQLNGQDRFSEREGSYFDVVQPFQHHTRSPDTGINCYSFALRPEEHQPSGSCNFSRIDNATLQLVLSSATVGGTATAKVRVYATSYNVLRVMSGMAGVAYSN